MAKKEYDFNDKLAFFAEWYDFDSSYHKKFILNFFPSDGTLDIYDRELSRPYLKRTTVDGVTFDDMFIGNTLRIYGRQVKIMAYADCRTQQYIGRSKDHTLAVMKSCVIDKLGEIISQIENRGFQIKKLRMCQLSRKEALEFYAKRKGEATLPFTLEQMVSGPVVAMELIGDNALITWRQAMGPGDPIEAKKIAPNSLRALYGKDSHATSGFHGSVTFEDAVREACFFFPVDKRDKPPESTAQMNNTTCCVVKPHAVHEGKLGYIISSITASHFTVTAAQMLYLSNANADEFLEVYKGVVSDYHALLMSFVDGPCVALEIGGKNNQMNVHEEFRKFVGPSDSEIARQIRPTTLRAIYGCDKYRNAVHCTDLQDDTMLELEYIFKICTDY